MQYPVFHKTLTAFDGRALPVLAWRPAAPHAVVQVAHGMGEHAGRYARLAQALVARGYAVYANHHRGHGPAAQDPARRGDFGPGGFDVVVRDMASLTADVRLLHRGLPIVLLGHSMGSFAAQLYALDHSSLIAGLALSGTAAADLRYREIVPHRKLEDANADVIAPRTRFDWLSRDESEVDKYLADPLCGFTCTPSSLASIAACCKRTAAPCAFAALPPGLPIYLFTGDQDPVNRHLAWFEPLVQRMREAGLDDVTTRVYPGARHEVLNETNRDAVTADLLGWLDRVTRS